jgi:hypothetical protein
VVTEFRPHPMSARALRAAISLVLALAAALALAIPAGALVTKLPSATVGLQPRSTTIPLWLYGLAPAPEEFGNPSGHPIVSASKTYAIYWDPTDHYHGDWQHLIDLFLQGVGADSGSFANVFSVDAQYSDAANQHALYKSALQGAYTDTDAYPASQCKDPQPLEVEDRIGPIVAGHHTAVCVTDKQVREELERFVSQHTLKKGMETIFYVLTPPGVAVCLDEGGPTGHCSDYTGTSAEESYENSFCSYHAAITPTSPVTGDESTILYAVIPWSAGGEADGHLTAKDQRPAFDCQDGGFDPSSKPIEKREAKKEKTKAEEEAFEKMNAEEKAEVEKREALEGPHQEEPNQGTCPNSDGSCDLGLADLIVNQIAVEQQNVVTNPLLNAWQDPTSGDEATDECRDFFASAEISGSVTPEEQSGAGTLSNQVIAGTHYYLNDAFNLASLELAYPAIPCIPGIRLEPQFTSPNAVNVNELVGFDGMESDITLDAGTSYSPTATPRPAYASYTWNFGDGSAPVTGYAPGAPSANAPSTSPCAAPWEAPCAASAFHSYQYGGTYEVTLTATDVGGNTASFARPITVVGPPPPSPSPTPSGSPTGAGSTSSVSSTTTGATPQSQVPPVPPTPAPVVTGFVESKSLKRVMKGGLAVRYTVNEQVAGSIQVLLDAATAKRLGIHGHTATGLPQGSPRLIVVGSAVLITTKAGAGTVRIKFSSRTTARLARLHKLKLTLRLFARNASRQSPLTTTTISTATLGR